ncbi:Molybdopterin oxidoreductase OS=Tsukamurella paurometabola (strain ATCC 8368 / DSM / CCUG 35730/ CIP 100753 / JCM 10117 / KCTC 9821 / NBRC 16120 / NCIMB 702349 / NCTC 13040) OX=521096 GN=Tpau_1381 PE=3 SV=1 [Tsukamurella paurometabola]|uniref:assimilatory sulfite reductase (NADPH) n=1 Tax=Tsukamurella paurometabola (strain ATCC 8368 / DSM 20162 / CCUG 35730 / CIP 100753 / JCM 10117 / KCTC 9821 / NBRC 16120 / NCIMB 702349 / NCTC 13040) TaxID=521096 RepID=D5UWY7_TSUPD|nr:bifunctional nitrate reductase/sulfite reductase flavoprotein subunit alpha [Tsukamurella paurometabola]ADG78009.1 molybdopterin oxidoreductase [Tsukamurella paurometabola DSM 20162]SUP29765.1 Nitrate reductase [Tsukamurella paurometabola]
MTTTAATVCGYCGVGCGLNLQVRDGRVIASVGREDHPSNRGRLCTKGATTVDLLAAGGRQSTGLVRAHRGGDQAPVGADEAVAEAGRRLRAVRDKHGPDAIAVYVSGQMSLEAQYLATKLAKGFLRTSWLESNSRLCMASAGTGYKQSLGADGPPGSYDDLDHADLFLVIGSNMADCHPILFLRMMDRVKAGAKLVVVDPRRTATAAKADIHLAVRPGTDLALLNGLLRLIVDAGAVDEGFVAAHTEGWEAMTALLDEYPVDRVAGLTGVGEDQIRAVAELVAANRNWVSLWTMGLNQSTHGTWNTNALVNLHLATGALCRTGAGPFSLTGQPNAMGGREMGYMGPGLPGQRSALVPADREFAERVWNLPPGTVRTPSPGGGTIDMYRRMSRGEIRAAWIICTNPVASVANRSTVIEALQTADVVIVQDAYAGTETAAYADVVLPAALWAEADGVMVNSERTLTLTEAATPPPGEARPDWRLICDIARELGHGDAFDYPDASAVFDEFKRFRNTQTGWDVRGADHERLRREPVQWPAAPGGPARNPIRYLDAERGLRFPTPSGRARFLPRPYLPPAELPDDEFPLLLTTGRTAHQWHTMTKTGRVAKLNKLNAAPFVQLHPEDAERLGIGDGDRVEIRSRRGRAVLPATVDPAVRPGVCFAPMHWNDAFGTDLAVNAVTSDAVDPDSLQPEFKACAVALTVVEHAVVPVAEPEDEIGTPDLTVIWASQTGTAEAYAHSCAEAFRDAGLAVRLRSADAVSIADLRSDRAGTVLFTVSTTGDGDAPDNGLALWDALARAEPGDLDDLRYSVLGFGDPNYADFCGFARKLDARLTHLGGARIAERVSCEPEFAEPARRWLDSVASALGTRAQIAEADESEYSRTRPLRTTLVRTARLSGSGSAKDVRTFVFDLPEGTLSYAAGDALGIWPRNRPEVIAEWATLTGVNPEAAPLDTLDLTRITPDLVRFLHDRAPSHELDAAIADPGGFAVWSWGRQALDLIAQHPVHASADEWLSVLRPLTPRLYSISSSPLEHPHEVAITPSIVGFDVAGRRRHGVSTGYLAGLRPGDEVDLFIQRTKHFRPPADPGAPAIMIGPGTGVAPFRGFLHDRARSGASGANWLFFGEQHAATDFYYRHELDALSADGVLTRLDVAFSRDSAAKVYVQDRMREHAAELWQWIRAGAHLYVCGDASRMARDVDEALRGIVAEHGHMAPRSADAYVAALSAERRYVRDVY